MALAEKLDWTPKRKTGKPCSVGALEEYLTGKEAEAFQAMMHGLGWAGNRIWAAVQKEAEELRQAGDIEGAAVHAALSEQQVNRHRSTSCRCFKQANA